MTSFTKSIGNGKFPVDRSSTRLAFIDNLRVFLTILVVAHHAAQPYGPTGGRWLIFNPERAEILGAFFSTNAAFFMGLFFLISGYCLPGAYDRKGAKQFLIDRFVRLGIPLLVFVLFVFPAILYAASDKQLSFNRFLMQTYLHPGQLEFGHLWFLVHLLIYALSYSICRQWLIRKRLNTKIWLLDDRVILIYLISLAIVTFIVRIWYPIDTWIRILGLIPVEVAHFPQYLSLFVIGIVAYRQHWLIQAPTRQGLKWLGIGLAAVLLRYLYSLEAHQLFPTRIIAGGGWEWRSVVWSVWEAVICVGLSVGLLILFRDAINQSGKWARGLAANAYTVYLIHLPIVIAIQLGFASVAMPPLAKFFLVTLLSLPLCGLVSYALRRLPLIRAIL